jgi:hypothetical protein
MLPRAYVEALSGDTLDDPSTCHLVLEYEGKVARIEIPVAKPQYDKEPSVDVYRRELQKILEALREVAESPQGIYWPHPSQRNL